MRSVYSLCITLCLALPSIGLAQPLQTKLVSELLFYPEYRFSAEVEPRSVTTISAKINAELIEFVVKSGEEIPAGQVLARLNCEDLHDQLELNQANQQELQANLRLAQFQFDRLNALQGRQLTSDSTVDESLARKQALEAQSSALKIQAKLAQRAISRCEIRAPFRGVVRETFAGVGQWLTVGAPLLSFTQLEGAELAVQLPLSLYQSNEFGALMSTAVLKQEGQVIPLQDWRLAKQVEPQSKMMTVWFRAPKNLFIGQQTQIHFTHTAPFLPAGVLVQRNGQVGVFVVENQQVNFIALDDAQMGRPAKWPSDWLSKPHVKIVVDGQLRLQSGDSLTESP
ncbi:efflux RND transporter periplasmic adaptor subunit [Thiomicrorhabdus indica]|uniref:efflux RND transporter periplasmic adaptor subunit n=1 Tax=Thiomicrorhabdus indica TaxID=2267253 RepID=UPI002AA7B106|nr:efflux RND transporter periplasmic adaptor subunit [Thiomicrorhabdus indica]